MATWPKILRLRRTDVQGGHLLLNIAKDGTRDLDINFIGTDQESLYRGSVKESGLMALQTGNSTGNSTGNLAEWKTIFAYVLLHQQPEGSLPEILEGVEAVSAISGTAATITIRRNVGGVTQKLGTVKLEESTDDTEVFKWVDAAVRDADELRSQLGTLRASVISQQEQVIRLTSELDQLVQAKKLHEEELLSKFTELLNTKKLKIRDQERLLRSGGQVEAASANKVSQARSEGRLGQRAGASRSGKRKAESTRVADEGETADEDEGAPTDDEDEEERRRQLTPETDDEDMTVDGSEDEGGRDNAPDDSQVTRRVSVAQSQSASQRMDHDKGSSPPQGHDLPTRQVKAPARAPTPPLTSTANDNAETVIASDDEEL